MVVVELPPVVLAERFAALLALVVVYCLWIVSILLAEAAGLLELTLDDAFGRLLVVRVAAC